MPRVATDCSSSNPPRLPPLRLERTTIVTQVHYHLVLYASLIICSRIAPTSPKLLTRLQMRSHKRRFLSQRTTKRHSSLVHTEPTSHSMIPHVLRPLFSRLHRGIVPNRTDYASSSYGVPTGETSLSQWIPHSRTPYHFRIATWATMASATTPTEMSYRHVRLPLFLLARTTCGQKAM